MTTYGNAVWKGGLKHGIGAVSTKSGALKDHPYGLVARFEGGSGTNPEELIGTAHSGCFTMALTKILGDAGFTATEMNTKAEITLEKDGDDFTISKSHLTLRAKIPALTRPSSRNWRAGPKRAAPCPSCSRRKSP